MQTKMWRSKIDMRQSLPDSHLELTGWASSLRGQLTGDWPGENSTATLAAKMAKCTRLTTILTLLVLAACRPESPDPPDPDEPIAPVDCDELAPLTVTRTTADSSLGLPGWLQVCTLCPATSIEFVADQGQELALESLWTEGAECAVSLAAHPLPDQSLVEFTSSVVQGENSGSLELDLELPGGRGENPVDLGTATWKLTATETGLRIPQVDIELLGLNWNISEILLSLGAVNTDGSRSITVGRVDPETGEQDPCSPTSTWAQPARLEQRQLGGALSSGDRLPTPLGGPLRRGAIQGRLSSTGSALQDVTILGLLDLNELEEETGTSPDILCDEWSAEADTSLCVSCGDPAEGQTGLPSCVPLIWEFQLAPMASAALFQVDGNALPNECSDSQ